MALTVYVDAMPDDVILSIQGEEKVITLRVRPGEAERIGMLLLDRARQVKDAAGTM